MGRIPKQSADSKRLFSVPNTEEGRLFLALMDEYGNHARHTFKKVGRGPNEGLGGGCRFIVADWIEVKIFDKRSLTP
jgi:hypothetical protein